MAEIQVIIDKHGDVQIIPVGFRGNECHAATAPLEAAFGADFKSTPGEGQPVIPVDGDRNSRHRVAEEL